MIASVALLAPVAHAYRTAPSLQARAIRAAVLADWRKGCGSKRFPFRHAYISTVNPLYAFGEIRDNGCNFSFGEILRRPNLHGDRWTIELRVLDSLQPCTQLRRHVPGAVLRDFHIEGGKGRQGNGPVPC